MDGHHRDLLFVGRAVVVHHQADVFEEIAQRLVIFHRAGEFGQVFQPPVRLGAAFGLKRGGIAAFVEDGPREFGRSERFRGIAPAGEIAHQRRQRAARGRAVRRYRQFDRRRDSGIAWARA
jgi:hypothetical protein